MYGSVVIEADRWYPSSKTCSKCGYKQDKLPLKIRNWTCPSCSTTHDRDINAATNLKQYALTLLKQTAVSFTVTVCGDASSGLYFGTSEPGIIEAEI